MEGKIVKSPADIVNSFAQFLEAFTNKPLPCISKWFLSIWHLHNCTPWVRHSQVFKTFKKQVDSWVCWHSFGHYKRLCKSFRYPTTNTFQFIPSNFLFSLCKESLIFKERDSTKFEDYRSISIISNFSRALERCIYDKIFLQVKQLLSLKQEVHSNNTAKLVNTISVIQQLEVTHKDFSKALSKMDHRIHCQEKHAIGIDSNLIELFQSYLSITISL